MNRTEKGREFHSGQFVVVVVVPQPRVLLLNAGYFGQFLTMLVQNLTLCNDCNLIPLAHGTQRIVLSK